MRWTWIPAVAAAIQGCTAIPLDDTNGSRFNGTVQQSPATAYRELTQRMRECVGVLANTRVDAEFYPDVNSARVALIIGSDMQWLRASIKPEGTGASVEAIVRGRRDSSREEWQNVVLPWAAGQTVPCPFDKLKPRPGADPSRGG
jgi:hypothetical protein